MKILHLNTVQSGGAAWCAMRINKALVQQGIDSRMLFAYGDEMPEGINGAIANTDRILWNRNNILRKIRNLLAHFSWYMDAEKMRKLLSEANRKKLFLHQPLSNFKNIAHHPLMEWADIIHLHWVADFVDYPSFFKEVRKPIVWTLHDKYPAVGVQHYCSDYYPVPNELKSIDDYCKKIKRECVINAKSLNIVAISEMMIDICKQSEILYGFPVTLIHNGIDISVFHPFDKHKVRKEFGIVSDTVVFLFSAYGIHDPNKGLDRVVNALNNIDLPNKMLVCIGGFSNKPIPETSFPVLLTGMLTNSNKIAKYYSAADYFLQCSFEETFAQTPLEAMACGTPVISTPCSGATDLIRDFNGIICEGYSADAIAKGINKALDLKYDSAIIRQYIVDNYQYDRIANQYIDLYSSILNQ